MKKQFFFLMIVVVGSFVSAKEALPFVVVAPHYSPDTLETLKNALIEASQRDDGKLGPVSADVQAGIHDLTERVWNTAQKMGPPPIPGHLRAFGAVPRFVRVPLVCLGEVYGLSLIDDPIARYALGAVVVGAHVFFEVKTDWELGKAEALYMSGMERALRQAVDEVAVEFMSLNDNVSSFLSKHSVKNALVAILKKRIHCHSSVKLNATTFKALEIVKKGVKKIVT